jgi:hypothetical protein
VERVQQTILEECWKPAFARYLIPKQTGLRLDLERYLRYYNTERAHTGRWTNGRTPEQVLGQAKLWAAAAAAAGPAEHAAQPERVAAGQATPLGCGHLGRRLLHRLRHQGTATTSPLLLVRQPHPPDRCGP